MRNVLPDYEKKRALSLLGGMLRNRCVSVCITASWLEILEQKMGKRCRDQHYALLVNIYTYKWSATFQHSFNYFITE